jgi:hypothetical protein
MDRRLNSEQMKHRNMAEAADLFETELEVGCIEVRGHWSSNSSFRVKGATAQGR